MSWQYRKSNKWVVLLAASRAPALLPEQDTYPYEVWDNHRRGHSTPEGAIAMVTPYLGTWICRRWPAGVVRIDVMVVIEDRTCKR
jgi:hypothetical protein